MTKRLNVLLNGIMLASGMLICDEFELVEMPILYLVILIVGLIYLFFLVRDDRTRMYELINGRYFPVYIFLALGIWSLLRFFCLIFTDSGSDFSAIAFYMFIFSLAIIGIYVVIHGFEFNVSYLVIMSISGVVISLCSICVDIFKIDFIDNLLPMINDQRQLSAVFWLTNMCVSVLFVLNDGIFYQLFCIGTGALTEILLIYYGAYLQLAVLVAFLLAIPVFLVATKRSVQRVGIMLGILVFLICNSSLVPYLIEGVELETTLSLDGSIFLDIVVVFVIIVFFNYWNKLPENVNANLLVLRRFRKAIVFLETMYVCVIVGTILAKEQIMELKDEGVVRGVKSLLVPLLGALENENMISYGLEKIDIVSMILLLIVFIRFALKGYERTKKIKVWSGIYFLLTEFVILGMLLWKVNMGIMTIAYIFVLLASFGNDEPRKIWTIPVNIENIKELLGDHLENLNEK